MRWDESRYGGAYLYAHNMGVVAGVGYEGVQRLAPDEPRYNVTVLGKRLKGREPTLEAGKARAQRVLRTWWGAGLTHLDQLEQAQGAKEVAQ